MIKFLLLLVCSFVFSQGVYFEYGYSATHSADKDYLGYGNEDSYLGLSYIKKTENRSWKTTFHYENWIFIKEDVFAKFTRNFNFYTFSQSVSVYEGYISVFPGFELNVLSKGDVSVSSSYGSIDSKLKKANTINYGPILDLLYFTNKLSVYAGIKYSLNDLLKDRSSNTFRLQFGMGYKF